VSSDNKTPEEVCDEITTAFEEFKKVHKNA
jgi:hypothetical protein